MYDDNKPFVSPWTGVNEPLLDFLDDDDDVFGNQVATEIPDELLLDVDELVHSNADVPDWYEVDPRDVVQRTGITYDVCSRRRNHRGQLLRFADRHGMVYKTSCPTNVQVVYGANMFRHVSGDPFYSISAEYLQSIVGTVFELLGDEVDCNGHPVNVLPLKWWTDGGRCGLLTRLHHCNTTAAGDGSLRPDEQDKVAVRLGIYVDEYIQSKVIGVDLHLMARQVHVVNSRGQPSKLNAENYRRCGQVLFNWPPNITSSVTMSSQSLASLLAFCHLAYYKIHHCWADEHVFASFDFDWLRTITFMFGPLQAQSDMWTRYGRTHNKNK